MPWQEVKRLHHNFRIWAWSVLFPVALVAFVVMTQNIG